MPTVKEVHLARPELDYHLDHFTVFLSCACRDEVVCSVVLLCLRQDLVTDGTKSATVPLLRTGTQWKECAANESACDQKRHNKLEKFWNLQVGERCTIFDVASAKEDRVCGT